MGNEGPNFANAQKYFGKNSSFLDFGLGWWEFSCDYFVGEIIQAVSTVAERLVGGVTAAAESDGSTSGEAEFVAGGVDNFEITFDQDWAIMFERNFCWH